MESPPIQFHARITRGCRSILSTYTKQSFANDFGTYNRDAYHVHKKQLQTQGSQ